MAPHRRRIARRSHAGVACYSEPYWRDYAERPRERGGRVAVVAGGGASIDLLEQSLARSCSTYVTGGAARRPEHSVFGPKFDAFRRVAAQHDVALIDGTHYGTEKPPQLAMVEWFRRLGLDARFEADGPKLVG